MNDYQKYYSDSRITGRKIRTCALRRAKKVAYAATDGDYPEETYEEIFALLEQISPIQRAVLVARFIDGYTLRQVAEIGLGKRGEVSSNQIRQTEAKGLRTLRTLWSELKLRQEAGIKGLPCVPEERQMKIQSKSDRERLQKEMETVQARLKEEERRQKRKIAKECRRKIRLANIETAALEAQRQQQLKIDTAADIDKLVAYQRALDAGAYAIMPTCTVLGPIAQDQALHVIKAKLAELTALSA